MPSGIKMLSSTIVSLVIFQTECLVLRFFGINYKKTWIERFDRHCVVHFENDNQDLILCAH